MEPKNRRPVSLPVLRIEIEDADGVHVYDPNGLVMARVEARHGADDAPVAKPVSGVASEISGEPAIYYRVDDLELRLSPNELYRLIERDLTPSEYSYLVGQYGMAFDWHDDFYDEEGNALQPLRDRG